MSWESVDNTQTQQIKNTYQEVHWIDKKKKQFNLKKNFWKNCFVFFQSSLNLPEKFQWFY